MHRCRPSSLNLFHTLVSSNLTFSLKDELLFSLCQCVNTWVQRLVVCLLLIRQGRSTQPHLLTVHRCLSALFSKLQVWKSFFLLKLVTSTVDKRWFCLMFNKWWLWDFEEPVTSNATVSVSLLDIHLVQTTHVQIDRGRFQWWFPCTISLGPIFADQAGLLLLSCKLALCGEKPFFLRVRNQRSLTALASDWNHSWPPLYLFSYRLKDSLCVVFAQRLKVLAEV